MKEVHDFTTPRNLYEKLIRDSERLEKELSGDNLFNFMATAHRLQMWIKKSPMAQHETIKRLLRKASRNPSIKECCSILDGKKSFKLVFEGDSAKLFVDETEYNPLDLKDEIVSIFNNYFNVK